MLPEASRLPVLRLLRLAGAGLACLSLSGCYLAHVSGGHMALMDARQPIAQVMASPDTPTALRERLAYVGEVRRFASDALALPDNGSFTTFVELGRPYVAWNVFAAREFSVEPRRWCFLVAGCVNYRGYFEQDRALDYARHLEREGYDVYVAPVAAYSTLGHFDDPVLSTMMTLGDAELAGLVFHELAHQVAYVPGDSAFNEAFATAVEMEGVRRWLDRLGRAGELAAYRQARERLFAVTELIEATRGRLGGIYASGSGARTLREAKAAEFERLREEYRRLRAGWTDGANYDRLLATDLNNARLAATSTYHQCLPGFTAMLAELDGYLQGFYRAVRRLGRRDAAEREAAVCRGPSAAGAAAEAGVVGALAFAPEVARDDAAQRVRLDAEPAEAASRADAVHGQ
ncbi:MAG: putative aminopeptidase [Proteobacteria bacterium]|nr:putative aminopeptidase [Pseudomonadota bacterium]